MLRDPLDRRGFVAGAATALAAAWLAARPDEIIASLVHARRAPANGPAWLYFTPEQAADVDAIAAQILPSDDLPGAREAGAVFFFDHALATWAQGQREAFTQGLAELNAHVARRSPGTQRFAALPSERQIELLKDAQPTPFFQMLRFATLTGTFADPSWGGNRDKVGWRILGFDDRFVWQPPFGDYDAAAGSAR